MADVTYEPVTKALNRIKELRVDQETHREPELIQAVTEDVRLNWASWHLTEQFAVLKTRAYAA